jgi:hypothetical protein
MANGIDDEPSGAQAYFTTAPPREQAIPSRPTEEEPIANDREGEHEGESQLETQMRDLRIVQDEQPAAVPVLQPELDEQQQHQQDYTYNDLHSDTALHGHNVQQPVNLPVNVPVAVNNSGIDMGLHSEAIGQGISESNPPPANQNLSLPANQDIGNHPQNPLPPMENPYIQINQFQPVSNPMSQLKGNEEEDNDENQRRTRAHAENLTNQRTQIESDNSRTDSRPATRPPLDAPRAPLRDPAANAPITPHETDPTPANRIPTNPVSNLEAMSNRPHTISNRSIPNSNVSEPFHRPTVETAQDLNQSQDGYQVQHMPAPPPPTQQQMSQPPTSQPQMTQSSISQPPMTQPALSQSQMSQPSMSQPALSHPQMPQYMSQPMSQSLQHHNSHQRQNSQPVATHPMQQNQTYLQQQSAQEPYQQQQVGQQQQLQGIPQQHLQQQHQVQPSQQIQQQSQQQQQQQLPQTPMQPQQQMQHQIGGFDPHTGQPYSHSGHMPPPPPMTHSGHPHSGHPQSGYTPNYGHPTSHPPPVSHPYMAQSHNPYMNNSFHGHGPGSIPGDIPERPMSRPGSVGPAPSILEFTMSIGPF